MVLSSTFFICSPFFSHLFSFSAHTFIKICVFLVTHFFQFFFHLFFKTFFFSTKFFHFFSNIKMFNNRKTITTENWKCTCPSCTAFIGYHYCSFQPPPRCSIILNLYPKLSILNLFNNNLMTSRIMGPLTEILCKTEDLKYSNF